MIRDRKCNLKVGATLLVKRSCHAQDRSETDRSIVVLSLVVAASSRAATKTKSSGNPIPNAILQVDSRAPKIWNVFQAGKKFDPLLLQLGAR